MEPHEVSAVLARASDLHAKISDAIDRSLRSDFPSTSHATDSSPEQPTEFVVDSKAEVRSLTAIRDALDVLEEQLECLQTLQHQQRAEKDATLAELEASRRILYQRLKEHRGREWEIVHEALAFTGGSVEEKDDLLLPPYSMRLGGASSFANLDRQTTPHNGDAFMHGNDVVRRLVLVDGDERDGKYRFPTADEDRERGGVSDNEEDAHRADGNSLSSRVFYGTLGQAVALAGKAVLIVMGVAAVVALSPTAKKWQTKFFTLGTERSFTSIQNPPQTALLDEGSQVEACPSGKVLTLLDGVKRCVVKERVELPFQYDMKNPDASYGRG